MSEGGSGGCQSCDTPESEIMGVYNRNFDYPWKDGNPYSRRCPNCGSVVFTSKTYWESQEDKYVIPKGDEEPVLYHPCPYDECDGDLLGTPEECPDCGGAIEWEDDSDEEEDEAVEEADESQETDDA